MRTQLLLSNEGPPKAGEYGPSAPDNKPFWALWTSTYLPEGKFASAWIEFNYYDAKSQAYLLDVDPESQIYEVDSKRDGQELIRRFPGPVRPHSRLASVDWDGVARVYDAVHMTRRGQAATRFSDQDGESFNGWDVESTAWFRYSFSRIRRCTGELVRE